jgi:hypothetical protein
VTGRRPGALRPFVIAAFVAVALVRSAPFAGECPTAYDGQKHVCAFPARGGDVVIDSCEFDLSHRPATKAVDAALFGT